MCVHVRGASDLRELSREDSKSTCFHIVLEGPFKRMQRLNTSLDPSSEDELCSFRFLDGLEPAIYRGQAWLPHV